MKQAIRHSPQINGKHIAGMSPILAVRDPKCLESPQITNPKALTPRVQCTMAIYFGVTTLGVPAKFLGG